MLQKIGEADCRELTLPEVPQQRGLLSDIQAILFDLDDTWIDTLHTSYEVVRRTALRLQLPPPAEDLYADSYGQSFRHMVQRWFPSSDVNTNDFRSIFERESLKSPTPALFQVKELVDELHRLGVKVGLVTNSSDERTQAKLRAIGVDPESLACVITQDSTGGVLKPHPRGMQMALKELGIVDPKRVLFVGNAVDDQAAAVGAGVHFCAVERLENWERDLLPSSFLLESAGQVMELLM